jgi:hypothetical protein
MFGDKNTFRSEEALSVELEFQCVCVFRIASEHADLTE